MRLGRQQRIIAIIVAVAVSAAAVGWFAARRIESPEEALARAEAPPASLIRHEISSMVLESSVIFRGDARFDNPVPLSAVPRVTAEGGDPVITVSPPEVGIELAEGELVAEISGRPLLVLAGSLPMYRDIRPGDSGPDVAQLEAALARLGFLSAAPDDRFDDAGEAAVSRLYGSLGYAAPGASAVENEQLENARLAVESEDKAVTAAKRALDEAKKPVDEATRLRVKSSLDSARISLESTRQAAKDADAETAQAVAAATSELDDARAAAELAGTRLQQARDGTHPDTGQPPTPEELTALTEAAAAADAAAVTAQDALDQAAEAAERTAADGENSVLLASQHFRLAELDLAELDKAPDTTLLAEALTEARGRAERAREQLAALDAEIGVRVPLQEVVYVEKLPRRIDRVDVALGDSVSGPLVLVSGTDVLIEGVLTAEQRSLVSVGDTVLIGDGEATGTIVSIDDEGVNQQGSFVLTPVVVVPDDPAAAEGLAGRNLRLEIKVGATAGEVLTVPITALATAMDGVTRVELVTDAESRSTTLVEVVTGLAVDGVVEISSDDERIREGASVVLGRS